MNASTQRRKSHIHLCTTSLAIPHKWPRQSTTEVNIKDTCESYLLLESSSLLWGIHSALTTTTRLSGTCTRGGILRHVHVHVLSLSDVLHVLLRQVEEMVLALLHVLWSSHDGHHVGVVIITGELDLHLGEEAIAVMRTGANESSFHHDPTRAQTHLRTVLLPVGEVHTAVLLGELDLHLMAHGDGLHLAAPRPHHSAVVALRDHHLQLHHLLQVTHNLLDACTGSLHTLLGSLQSHLSTHQCFVSVY
ncbi:hypothetical protein E2C01_013266 [Portunus trituberculatus]|uniref:Uncharacterized protein n=1 Tax=Portunus trituberculatus TaxID=210409 RepID=A0A5B7DGT6_PORTR|nr:hypothetical protein [Portunus trituberculatus]